MSALERPAADGWRAPGAVSDTELRRRRTALADVMARLELDSLVVGGHDDDTGVARGRFHYVTDFESLNGHWFAVLLADGDLVVLQPAYVGRTWADRAVRGAEVVVAVDQAREVAAMLREREADGRVGVVGLADVMRPADLHTVHRLLPAADLVDATDEVDRLMAVKSGEEVARLEETAAMFRAAFDALSRSARPGVTERAVASAAFQVIKELGGTTGFLLIARSGGIPVFHPPTDDVLQRGDVIGFDLEHRGPSHYALEATHYVSLGAPDARWAQALDREAEVFEAGRRALRPGARSDQVMAAMADAASAAGLELAGPTGLGPVQFHGHGIGLTFFCPPYLPGDDVIAPGMALALHPWTGPERDDVLATVALDTVVVGETSTRALVQPVRELVQL
jgi:Xaa-Pro aminopeptidase